MRKSMIVAAVFLAALLGLWAFSAQRPLAVKVFKVEQGPLYATVAVTGKVVSKREVALSASAAGQLQSIAIKEGDRVTRGQVLARLDDREAQANLAKAQADYERAQEESQQAARLAERTQRLFAAGGEAQQSLEDAQLQAQGTAARMRATREELALAQVQRDKTILRAPFAGTVTQNLAQIGQWVTPGLHLFTIVDFNEREIEAKVDAGDSAAIQIGQEAQVASDAFPNQPWVEHVTRLAPAVQKDETANTFNVRLSLGALAPALRFGQQVDLKIRTAARANALKVPFTALLSDKGKTAVAIVDRGKIKLVPVVTGIEDATHTEIVQGLSAGQEIALPQGKKFKSGDAVRVTSDK